jgi:cytochrome P450 family 142 subfamily A polypeptide 1
LTGHVFASIVESVPVGFALPRHPSHPDIRLLDGAFYAADPHPYFEWMRNNAPVYWDEQSLVWGISRYDDVMAVSRDPTTFCNAHGMRPDAPALADMINLDDPLHKKRRNLVNKGFTVRRVSEMEPRIRAICAERLDDAKRMGRFDFVHDLAAWVPLSVIGDMLGAERDMYADLLRWSDEMVVASGATDLPRMEGGMRAFDAYITYQRSVLEDRRSRPPCGDLISILAHSEMDGYRLADEEILMESLLILVGGDETTRHVMTEGMFELLRRPQDLRRLAENPAVIPVAVEEMLRWVSPIKNMARTATRDAVVGGETICKGQKLILLYPSANRDAAKFPDPMRFDVARSPNEHIAFGFGPHYCLGASLARLELKVFFEEALARLPTLRLLDEEPPRRPSNFISGIERLMVELA